MSPDRARRILEIGKFLEEKAAMRDRYIASIEAMSEEELQSALIDALVSRGDSPRKPTRKIRLTDERHPATNARRV